MLEQNFDDKEAKKKKFYKSLVFWVLVGLCLGIIVGTIGSFHKPNAEESNAVLKFFYDFSVVAKEYTMRRTQIFGQI